MKNSFIAPNQLFQIQINNNANPNIYKCTSILSVTYIDMVHYC